MNKLLCNLMFLVLLFFAQNAHGQAACTHYASPNGTGNGLSPSSPFRITNFKSQAAPGQVLCLLDGTYTNPGDGLELGSVPSGTPGNPITVRALNDGGAFIDGQHNHRVFFFNGTSYWTIQGIDFANNGGSDDNAMGLGENTHHLVVQRVCGWNATTPVAGVYSNSATWGLWNSHDNLFEDICAFGWGRNTFIDFEAATKNNIFRRVWVRWDGWADGAGATCPGPAIQTQYYTAYSNDIHDNWISIFSGGLYKTLYSGPGDPNHQDGFPCGSLGAGLVTRAGHADQSQGEHWNGFINYGYPDNNDILGNGAGLGLQNRWAPIYFQDVFSDSRFGRAGQQNINLYACDFANADHYDIAVGSDCNLFHADRLTSIRNGDQQGSFVVPVTTNFNDCTSLGACPNFYTGVGSGGTVGSRACFEYQNGSLTSTPLWPWRMDDRIKQALARSGIAPTLQGGAGTGYASNTVTSEIVSRYGAIPSQCLRAGGGPPPVTSFAAWWHFNENGGTTTADSTGNGHNFTLGAGATWGAPKVGPSSLRCTGATQPPMTTDTAFPGSTYSWLTWINGEVAPNTTGFSSPFANGPTNAGTDGWGLWWNASDSALTQSVFHRDGAGEHNLKITPTLVANTWYHLAVTYDGTTLRLYVNGQPQSTLAVSPPVDPSGPFQVCGRYFLTPWAGVLDELRVDSQVWTPAQVLAEYNMGVSRSGNWHRMLAQ
jgi:hypothetical protein